MSDSLEIRQEFDASPRELFHAWTDPALLRQWAWGTLAQDAQATVEPRVGGRFEVRTQRPDGGEMTYSGTYLEVVQDRRLVHTVEWSVPMGYDTSNERVSVDFHDRGDPDGRVATELVFVHDGVPLEEARRVHEEGWRNTFGVLADVLRRSTTRA